jgi:hypothetical protein
MAQAIKNERVLGGVWQELPTTMGQPITIDDYFKNNPGSGDTMWYTPSRAELELENYCRSASAWNNEDPSEFPLQMEWAQIQECPECEQVAVMANSDYICVRCRHSQI